jgi:hypothetical protein
MIDVNISQSPLIASQRSAVDDKPSCTLKMIGAFSAEHQ